MNEMTYVKLQFAELKNELKLFCASELGTQLIEQLEPSANIDAVKTRLTETTEARTLVDQDAHLPIVGVSSVVRSVEQIEKGIILEPEQLLHIANFLRGCRKLKNFMREKEFFAPTLSSYAHSIEELTTIEDQISVAIVHNQVASSASSKLSRIRKAIESTQSKIQDRLMKFLNNPVHQEMIQEFFISKKDDRFTIPIKASYKHHVDGTVIEQSSKGATVFIEPTSVAKLANELAMHKAEEAVEEYQVLATLTGYVAENIRAIKLNMEVMGQYDFAFAKGKWSKNNDGMEPHVNNQGIVQLVNCRHPLLSKEAVPLNVSVGESYRGVVITGPNAGGKTVVLKTIGLLTLATMAGMHITGDQQSNISLFDNVFVDIGDNQSMENALSTFSSHMQNMSQILQSATKRTLLLFDEIGSGTEPNEGAALAIALLEEFYQIGCITVATTHYGEIKRFSELHPDFMNAAMLFNPDTLEPLYQLIIGTSGESNALWIARKMQLKNKVIEKAAQYMKNKEYDLRKVKKEHVRKSITKQKKVVQEFAKGDKVTLLEDGSEGLIYELSDAQNNVTVYCNGEMRKVNTKRVQLEIRATELYPKGYDIDSLFTSYTERKLQHDLARGSKKAIKKLFKNEKE